MDSVNFHSLDLKELEKTSRKPLKAVPTSHEYNLHFILLRSGIFYIQYAVVDVTHVLGMRDPACSLAVNCIIQI